MRADADKLMAEAARVNGHPQLNSTWFDGPHHDRLDEPTA
jgi:hypothetical protein